MKPMKFLGAAAVAGALCVAAGTIYQASADTTGGPAAMQADAGPDGGPDGGPDAGPPGGGPGWGHKHGGWQAHGGPGGWGPGGWGHGGPGGWHHHDDMFGLFAQSQDKDLTAADVKVIAQAILLEHGQHQWTVTNVASANGAIDFSYATAHGDVVASFSVDPKTGHLKRTS